MAYVEADEKKREIKERILHESREYQDACQKVEKAWREWLAVSADVP
jgi:hypothetical protein